MVEGGVRILRNVAVETRVEGLRDSGKRKENSRVTDCFGARQSTVVAGILVRKLKYVSSVGHEAEFGTLILLPEVSEMATPVRLEARKKEREID